MSSHKIQDIYIALENIRSLYNVGAILRTCEFLGFNNLLLIGFSGVYEFPSGKKIMHPKLKKTSLGTEKILNIQILDSSEDFLSFAKGEKFAIHSLELHPRSIPLSEVNFRELFHLSNSVPDDVMTHKSSDSNVSIEPTSPALGFSSNSTLTLSSNVEPRSEPSPFDICGHIFVVGNEKAGVSESVLEASSTIIEIKRHGSHPSLNVTTSLGMLLYAIRSSLK